ncbi:MULTISPECIES: c-type cytochrome [Mesorhizobium]|uniref:Cytochrome c family protein n=1 Tax=Mesorhizobium neociceri TaxID=1307853 RepID=A0A838B886_9HYPH|nr:MULTISPECIES: cytochrome c family protein [Mesorhizobium]MBA1142352.1 cytochrome c family protein [Mesorhizobium neociceri]
MAYKNTGRPPYVHSGSSWVKRLSIGAGVALALLPRIAQAQDIEAGKALFKKCAGCHNADTDSNKVGPTLKGVVARTAGSVPGYLYSKAMRDAGAAGLVWDEPNLTEYLANPKAKVPTNKMGFPGLANPDDIKNVIAYLKSVSG